MRFLSCLVSICFVFTSIGTCFMPLAEAAIAEAYAADGSDDFLRLQKEKTDLERKYFKATLERSKLENELLEYKDKYIELESSLPLEISKEKAPLENKVSDLKRELHNNKEQLLKTLSESERLRRDIANKEESLFRLQDEHVRLKTDHQQVLREKRELESQLSAKTKDLQETELAKARLASDISELEGELNKLQKDLPKSMADVKRPLEKKIRILSDDLKQRDSELKLANKQLLETKEQLDQRLTRLSKVTGESQACESQLIALQSELNIKKEEILSLRKKETELEKKYYAAEREKIEIERILADVKEKYEHLDKSVHSAIAQERVPLQQELAVMNNSVRNYEKQMADLEIEIRRLEDKLAEKDDKIFALDAQYKDAQSRMLEAQSSQVKAKNKSQELVRKVDSLTELLNKAVADNATKDQKAEGQELRIAQVQDDYQRIKAMLDSENESKAGLSEKLNDKNKELIAYQEKIQDLSDEIADNRVELKDSKKRLREKQSKITEPLQQKIVMLKMKIEEQDSIIGSLTQRLDDTTQELGSKINKIEQIKDGQVVAEEELLSAKQKLSALKLDLDMLKEQKLAAESNLLANERDKLDIEASLKALKEELETLKNATEKEQDELTLELQEKVRLLNEQKIALDKKTSKLNKELGMTREKLAVHQGLVQESEKTLEQNEETIESMRAALVAKDVENKNLMAKIISLNEELNTVQKDLSVKKAEIARYKERMYFLEQNQEFLRSELEKESTAKGSIDSELKEKQEALSKVQENEKQLAQELGALETKLEQMKNSLAQKVAVAKEPLQTKILELAATLRHEDERIATAEKRFSELKQKIEEKTRSVLRLQRKLSPYDEALGQTSHEKTQRETELASIMEEKQAMEAQIAGLKDDYKNLQRELDDAKREQKKRGLKYSRSQDPLFDAVEQPVSEDAGRLLQPLQEKINGLSIKVQARSDELQALYTGYKVVKAKYEEKKLTLERLADETVLYNDALGQTKKEIVKLNSDIEKLAQEKLDLKEKLDVMVKEATVKRNELDSLKVKHVEVESSLLDQVVQTRNLLQKKVDALTLQQKEYQKTILAMTGEAEILRKQLQEKDIQIAALEKRISIDSQARESIEQQLKEQVVITQALEEEKNAFTEQLAVLDKEAMDKDKQIEMLNERIAALQKEHDRFAQLIKRNSSEKEYLTRELIAKTETLAQLNDEQILYVSKIEELENKNSQTKASMDNMLVNARKPLQDKIAKLTEQVREKTHFAADCSAKVRELEILMQQRNKENSRMAIDVSEAQLRLDKTRETLNLRAQELDSLRKHKLNLEKQLFQVQVDYDELVKTNAKTEAEYQSLKADFNGAVEKKTDELNGQLAALKVKYDALNSDKKSTEAELDNLRRDIDTQKRLSEEFKEKVELKDYKLAQVDKTVQDINAENKSLQSSIKGLNIEIDNSRKREQRTASELDLLRKERNTLLNEQSQLKTLVEQGSGEAKDISKQLTNKTKKLARLEEEYLQAQKHIEQLKEKVAKSESQLETKLTKLSATEKEETAKLRRRILEREDRIAELNAKLSNLQSEKKAARLAESDAQRSIEKIKKQLAIAEKEIVAQKMTIQELNDKLATEKKSAASLQKENTSLSVELAKSEKRYSDLLESKEHELKVACLPLEKELDKLRHSYDELEIVYKKLKEEMPSLSQQLAAKERLAADCEKDLEGNEKYKKELLEKVARLEAQLALAKAEAKSSKEQLQEEFKVKLKTIDEESKATKSELKASLKELDYVQKELDVKNDKIAQLTKDNTKLQDSNLALKQKLDNKQSTIASIQVDCDTRLDMAKTGLSSQVKTLKAQLLEKDAKIKLLADHIDENKKIVASLKGEMKLFVEQSVSQGEAYKKSQRDLAEARAKNQRINGSEDDARIKNEELYETINAMQREIAVLKKDLVVKDQVISARDSEIQGLNSDQKELTEFLRKEIRARKDNIKELMSKTKALNEIKKQQKLLVEKLRAVESNKNIK